MTVFYNSTYTILWEDRMGKGIDGGLGGDPDRIASRGHQLEGEAKMRKIAAGLFMSLDGVVEFPERWGFQYMDDDLSKEIVAGIEGADAVLLGPLTYKLFSRMWPHQTDDVPMAKFLNHSLKYVVSRTPEKLGKLEWGPATLLKGELASAVARVKAEPGKTIQVPGSPKLVRTLLQEGLLDELSLTICPEIVGSGMRLFDEVTDSVKLTAERSRILGNGAISVTYRPSRIGEQGARQPLHFPDAASRK
jgi:dihydrofolate reductase